MRTRSGKRLGPSAQKKRSVTKSNTQPVRVEVNLGLDRFETHLRDLERRLTELDRQQQSWVEVMRQVVQANTRLMDSQNEVNNRLAAINQSWDHMQSSLQALHHGMLGNAQSLGQFRGSFITQLNNIRESLDTHVMLTNHTMGLPANAGRRLLAPRANEQGAESDGLGTENDYEVSLVNNGDERGNISDYYESISSDEEEEEQTAGDDSSENGNRGGNGGGN